MNHQQFQTQVEEKYQLNDHVIFLKLKLLKPTEMNFQAGQFVSIQLKNDEGKPIMRPYSILSSPSEKNSVAFSIKIFPDGKVTPFINKLKEGDTVNILGPLGKFVIDEDSNKPICFIATTVGIAPFRSMILDQIEKESNREMKVYFGFRHIKDIFFQEEFETFCKDHSNFECTFSVSRPENEDYEGKTGRLTEIISKDIDKLKNHSFYLCGNGAMIEDIVKLLEENGISKEYIHFEKYY